MQRDWSRLGAAQRKRYLGAGRKRGLTEAQVVAHYESGGNLNAWRGQGKVSRTGVSERQWAKLIRAAKESQLGDDRIALLEDAIAKGFTVAELLRILDTQRASRTEFRTELKRRLRRRFPKRDVGYEPGRARYHARSPLLSIEFYFYH